MTASTQETRSTGTEYLQRLVRQAAAAPAVRALGTGSPPGHPADSRFAELHLYLVAPGLITQVGQWLEPVGEVAFSGQVAEGWRVVTTDGLTLTLVVVRESVELPAEGLQMVFERGAAPQAQGAAPQAQAQAQPQAQPQAQADAQAPHVPGRDLSAEAAHFWHSLYQALAAIGRECPFSAHGHLEPCRESLLSLYRLALAPGAAGEGFIGIESLPGAEALDGLTEWLVAPLQTRAQWRSAHRMAAAYENLMLPLTQRLGLAYPWAMRNLAFGRLDQVRPDRLAAGPDGRTQGQAQAPGHAQEASPAPEPPTAGGPVRFRIKSRRRS